MWRGIMEVSLAVVVLMFLEFCYGEYRYRKHANAFKKAQQRIIEEEKAEAEQRDIEARIRRDLGERVRSKIAQHKEEPIRIDFSRDCS